MSEHRIAMVGTPCEIMAASKLQYYTDSPIDVKLGLFCMENFSYKYFVNLLKEYDLKMDDIEKFQIEKGFVFLLLKTKETVKIPLSVAKRIIRKNCNICVELTSETSDISIGSIGSEDGWSTLIIRTDKGEEIVNGAIEQKFIETKDFTDSQFGLLNRIAESKISKNLETIRILEAELYNEKPQDPGYADFSFDELKEKFPKFKTLESLPQSVLENAKLKGSLLLDEYLRYKLEQEIAVKNSISKQQQARKASTGSQLTKKGNDNPETAEFLKGLWNK